MGLAPLNSYNLKFPPSWQFNVNDQQRLKRGWTWGGFCAGSRTVAVTVIIVLVVVVLVVLVAVAVAAKMVSRRCHKGTVVCI